MGAARPAPEEVRWKGWPRRRVGDLMKGGTLWDVREPGRTHPNRRPPQGNEGERDVGLDAHASSGTLGVMTPSGKRVGSHVVETNARCLIEAVRQIPQPRHICLEEGTLSE